MVVLRSGHRLSKPLLDISGRVSCCGERGLFSIAFDPRFGNNHLLYAYYTNRQGSIEIDEFRAPSGTRVVHVLPPQGDRDPAPRAVESQRGATPVRSRRVPVRRHRRRRWVRRHRRQRPPPQRAPRKAPADRPPPTRRPSATRCRRAIRSWASPDGTRSTPTGSGTHTASRSIRQSNSLAIGDVGQDTEEELDYTKIQRASGANFGWPRWEGDFLFNPNRPDPNPNPPFPVFPILTYTHSSGCAIIGGYVVHDRGLPSLRGRYLYTDLCGGVIRSVVPRLGSATGDRSTGLQ